MTSPAHTRRPVPIVLDVDTGVDDACALLLAALHPDLDLRAVSCVGGNARSTTSCATRSSCSRPPAAPTCRSPEEPPGPLLEHPVDARHVHGDDGMGDLGWPAPETRPDSRHAVELLRDVCREAAAERAMPVTLVPLAPLTNIALLLRTYPEAAEGISEIVFMAGAADVGNATASAEFNVFHDPEAAAIALDAAADLGIPVTMYGLEVFYKPVVTREEAAELVAVGGRGRSRARRAAPAVPARALRARRLDDRRRRGRLRGHRPGVADDEGAAGARRARRARGHAGAPSSTAATGPET